MIYTIGHSTRSAKKLVALLREASVDLLVDVRTVPRSRFNTQFNAAVPRAACRAAGAGRDPSSGGHVRRGGVVALPPADRR
jgi:uncharacterized protein (DUF488 family)